MTRGLARGILPDMLGSLAVLLCQVSSVVRGVVRLYIRINIPSCMDVEMTGTIIRSTCCMTVPANTMSEEVYEQQQQTDSIMHHSRRITKLPLRMLTLDTVPLDCNGIGDSGVILVW